jgi:hypothetical protein
MPHYTYMLVRALGIARKIRAVAAFKVAVSLGILVVTISLMSFGAQSAAISQGYKPDGALAPGALVAIEAAQNAVTAADPANSNGLLGVVVGADSASLAVNNTDNMVQVATNGTAQVFVSDLNGHIKTGDQIAPSPIRGVGMKSEDSGKVIGVAQADFDGSSSIKTTTVPTNGGSAQTAHIGVIPVAVQVIYYTVPAKGAVPAFLQQFAVSVTGKTASVAQLVIVLIIVAAALIVVGFLMFAAVRGSIVSLGRNPLAATSIYRGTLQAVAASMTILGIAVAGAYMVLRF